jgi:hypothetical protein
VHGILVAHRDGLVKFALRAAPTRLAWTFAALSGK